MCSTFRIWKEILGAEMLDSLSTNIRSLSKNSQATVNGLIRSMKADKDQLSSLVSSINSFSSGGDFSSGVVAPFSVMNREILLDLFRDSFIRISRLFRVVNSTGIAVSSMIDVFTSEIEKVEKDIDLLNAFVDTYEYTSGKDDLYDFSYVEKFNDLLNSYTSEGFNFIIPDRSKEGFINGNGGYVDSFSGLFKMGNSYQSINVIDNIKSIKIDNNYSEYISSSSNFIATFTETLKDSWSVTVKSPHILNTTLDYYSKYLNYANQIKTGAQTAVQIEFNTPVDCDSIRITPNDGRDLFLSQIVLFTDEFFSQSNNIASGSSEEIKPYKLVLENPVSLYSMSEIPFNRSSISKIILIFNQVSYVRSRLVPTKSEVNSKILQDFINYKSEERLDAFSESQDVVYKFLKERTDISRIRKSNSVNYSYYSSSFPNTLKRYVTKMSDRLRMAGGSDKFVESGVYGSPVFMDLVKSMASSLDRGNKVFDSYNYIDSSVSVGSNNPMGSSSFMISRNSNTIDYRNIEYSAPIKMYGISGVYRALSSIESADAYEYLMSIQSVEFLASDNRQVDKAVFVSKKLPVNAHIEAIKASARIYNNDSEILKTLDIPSSISYELSVSNVEIPELEKDWQPLAFSDQSSIQTEVLFPDSSTYTSTLRFRPILDTVVLYADGIICDPSKYYYNSISNSVTINETFFNSRPNSIYVVSYDLNTKEYSPNVIDFVKNNSFKETIRRYQDSDGFGQKFTGPFYSRTIILDYAPYVRPSSLISRTYSQTYGTVFSQGLYGNSYKPVTIIFEDGMYAVDITNYTDTAQRVSFFASTSPLFMVNGNQIVFDRQINQNFIVDYEYIPYNLRFRFVLRKNLKNIDSLASIDSLLIKAKTSSSNPFYDKLVKTSIAD